MVLIENQWKSIFAQGASNILWSRGNYNNTHYIVKTRVNLKTWSMLYELRVGIPKKWGEQQ